jgi:hypothetical protein
MKKLFPLTPPHQIRFSFNYAFLHIVASLFIASCSSDSHRSRPSDPDAKTQYELGLRYSVTGREDWAIEEYVDVVTRFPTSHEAQLSAISITVECAFINPQDFWMLTGRQCPADLETRSKMLWNAFQRHGILSRENQH